MQKKCKKLKTGLILLIILFALPASAGEDLASYIWYYKSSDSWGKIKIMPGHSYWFIGRERKLAVIGGVMRNSDCEIVRMYR